MVNEAATYTVPMVVDQTSRGERGYDILSLFKERPQTLKSRRDIQRMNARLQELVAADTGKSPERVAHDINCDYWMSALEAKDDGVIDLIHGHTAATVSADLAEAAMRTTVESPAVIGNGRH